MARKIEPYKPPSSIIAPHPSDAWNLDASEQHVMDSYAQEHVGVMGTVIDFYSLSIAQSTRDALYGESTAHVFAGPFRMKAYVSYPTNTINVGDSGQSGNWSGQIWIPRLSLEEANCPAPAEGDIFRVWRLPYWDDSGILRDDAMPDFPGAGLYFNLTNVDEEGVIFDNPNFVGFQSDYSRSTTFTPERRLGDDQ